LKFGLYELDAGAERLTRDDELVHLPPQAMKLLMFLVSRAGQLVTRDDLRDHLWGGKAADYEKGINFCVNQVRQALDDDAANPTFIETVPRRGYRFVHAVDSSPTSKPGIGKGALFGTAAVVLVLFLSRGLFGGATPVVIIPTTSDGAQNDYLASQFHQALQGGLADLPRVEVILDSENPSDLRIVSSLEEVDGQFTVYVAVVLAADTIWNARMRGSSSELQALERDLIAETTGIVGDILDGTEGNGGETEVTRSDGIDDQ
jgi:DNA-binding winged helix-turn-helix (wHTH) protein